MPYATFRDARRRGSEAKAALERAQQEWATERQALRAEMEELKRGGVDPQIRQDYDNIVAALQAHPDVARLLEQRLREGGGMPVPARANGHVPPEVDTRLKSVNDRLDKLDARHSQEERAALQAEQRARNAETHQKLDAQIGQFLTRKNYGPEFLALARDYVLSRAMEDAWSDMELEDVPIVLSEWHATLEKALQTRQEKLLAGKKVDAGLPPTPGAPAAPVRQEAQVGANDNETARHLESLLRSQAGW